MKTLIMKYANIKMNIRGNLIKYIDLFTSFIINSPSRKRSISKVHNLIVCIIIQISLLYFKISYFHDKAQILNIRNDQGGSRHLFSDANKKLSNVDD